ncbi:MAG: glycosyltransferase family 2 protein [Brumimicrobium sp.]|nr:glycosyltransferase family 2 protein [Brumimicrobium sp.]
MGRFSKHGSRNVVLIFNIGTCKMELSIIIVNYKTPILTHRCIESIYQSKTSFNFEIIVVDNFSQDDSEKIITKDFPEVKWINNTYNAGFGRANNLGVSQAKGEYILLLNSDMLLSQDLHPCIEKLEESTLNGVLGCQLQNEDGSFQKSCYYDVGTIRHLLSYNILWYKLFKPQPKSLDAVMGSFMLIRKTDFDVVGGFDKDFFMYAEELEMCYRVKKKGKKIVYFDKYIAIHKHGGSSTESNWTLRQNLLSNALLYLKTGGWLSYLSYHLIYHFNIITNTFLSFSLSKNDRQVYQKLYIAYLSNYFRYFYLPFIYSFKKNREFLKVKR